MGPFIDTVLQWERNLSLVYEIVDQWVNFTQRKWLYMETIFVDGGETRRKLPEVADLFDSVDGTYRTILNESAANPSVMAVCMAPDRLNVLHQLTEHLEKCQQLLNAYLETKRHVFPRFYFISPDELLSILGSGSPTTIQEHVITVFSQLFVASFRSFTVRRTMRIESNRRSPIRFRCSRA